MISAEPTRRPRDDDDELPGLPAIDGPISGDDAPASDLAIDEEHDEGGETIGLDASTGVEDDEDFLDELGGEGEDGGWEASDDAAAALGGDDVDARDDEESSWTEGSESAEAEGWDADLEAGDDDEERSIAPVTARDQGEEGVEERWESEGDDDAPAGLPAPSPRASREDELAEDLELEGEGEIDERSAGLDERSATAGHPALALPRAPAEVRWLGPDDDAIVATTSELAAGRTLYRIGEERAEAIDADVLEGDEATSVARAASGRVVVGLRLGGVARSIDAEAARFERAREAGGAGSSAGAFHVLAEPFEGGVRLWGRSRGGALVRSEDEGATWSRPLVAGAVLALGRVADGGGIVGVLGGRGGAQKGALRVVRSEDGGRSWRNLAGPPVDAIPEDAEVFVAARGAHVVIAIDAPGAAPFVSDDDGATWRAIGALRGAGAIAIVGESGAGSGAGTGSGGVGAGNAVLYAALFVAGSDRGVVARVELGTDRAEVVVDLEEVRARHHVIGAGDPEGDQRVKALVAERAGGRTTLLIASGIGLVRALV